MLDFEQSRRLGKESTDPVCLGDVHVSVSVVVHLLVDVPDGLEAQDGVFVMAQGLVDSAQLWKRGKTQTVACEEMKQRRGECFCVTGIRLL